MPDQPPEGGVDTDALETVTHLLTVARPGDSSHELARRILDAIGHDALLDRLEAAEKERDDAIAIEDDTCRLYKATKAENARLTAALAALQRVVEAAEAENATLREQLQRTGLQREAAERVCWALDDLGIRCPFCDAEYVALPKDHADICEWKRWRTAAPSQEEET